MTNFDDFKHALHVLTRMAGHFNRCETKAQKLNEVIVDHIKELHGLIKEQYEIMCSMEEIIEATVDDKEEEEEDFSLC